MKVGRIRAEQFGAIVSLEEPPMLAWVDRALAKSLGMAESPLWQGSEDEHAPLQAPTEVHLLLTGHCPARCTYCYANSGPDVQTAPTLERVRESLHALARLGVFHVALGGGESLMRDDLFLVASEARALGLIPNLTTSGLSMTAAEAARCRIFGQVNVSLDGVGERHRLSRGDTSFKTAARALRLLVEAGVPAGINTVLTRQTWDGLDELVAYAAEVGANEVELLRLKPVGRAQAAYASERLTDEQHLELLPKVLALARTHRLHLKLDCSFAPMICAHAPPREVLEAFSIVGCDGGNSLGAIMPDGSLAGCSFAPVLNDEGRAIDLHWASSQALAPFRRYPLNPPEPCRSCPYRSVCKGGCHAVASFLTGQFEVPDPECPRVLAWASQNEQP